MTVVTRKPFVRFGSQADILLQYARPAAMRRLQVLRIPTFRKSGFERPLSPQAVVRSASWGPSPNGQKQPSENPAEAGFLIEAQSVPTAG